MHPWEMRAALLRIQEDFDWPVRSNEFEVTETWERDRAQTQFFRLVGVDSDLDLVAKTSDRWTDGDVRHAYGASRDLAEVFKPLQIEGATFIDPMGWSSSPPLLVMPYVESEQLSVVVRGDESTGAKARYLERTGEMLAAYHRAHPVDDPRDLQRATEEALDIARRLPGGESRARQLVEGRDHQTAYLFSDTSLGNVLLTVDDELLMIDPPTEPLPGLIHRDLGNLLFDLRTKLAGRATDRGAGLDGYEDLRHSFLSGYFADVGGCEPSDERLIALYEFWRASGMTRKRLRSRLSDVPWFAGLTFGSAARFLGRSNG